MKQVMILLTAMMMIAVSGCRSAGKPLDKDLLDRENLVAWCIVPFDARERTPEQRAQMLNELGISRLAYDYRDRHLASFEEEIRTLKEHGIRLQAVWLWVEPAGDTLLNSANETVLKILERTGTETELWLSFPAWVFDGSDADNIRTAVHLVGEVLRRADAIGCTVSLYNHGDWFGEPVNQLRIIGAIGSGKLKMVYNFHHGHHHMDRFGQLFPLMLPYLSAVNINGMSAEGPKIITLGAGDRELEMMRIVRESGYRGPVGIIGHTEGEDIRDVLERNLEGLEKLRKSL